MLVLPRNPSSWPNTIPLVLQFLDSNLFTAFKFPFFLPNTPGTLLSWLFHRLLGDSSHESQLLSTLHDSHHQPEVQLLLLLLAPITTPIPNPMVFYLTSRSRRGISTPPEPQILHHLQVLAFSHALPTRAAHLSIGLASSYRSRRK